MAQKSTIRPLRPADLDAVVAIDRERSGRSRTEFYARRFRTLAEDPRSVALVAEQGSRAAGFALAHVIDGEFGAAAPVGVLDTIGVLPSLERAGVATALLAGLETALAGLGARELRSQADWTAHGIASFFSASGFRLAPRIVLERPLDHQGEDEFAWEDLPVRSMTERDLPAIIRLDRKVSGRDRTAYLTRKAAEVLKQSAIRMSLVAELQGQFAGFLMARVDFGEFGRTEGTAELDTIGVDPDYARQRVGRALLEQLLLNVRSLRAERVVTEVEWDHLPLLGFLRRTGFRHAQRLAFEKVVG